MLNKNLPLPHAFFRLQQLFRQNGLAFADTQALTWLAAARLYASDKKRFLPNFSLDYLESETGWKQVVAAGLAPQALLRVHDRGVTGLLAASTTKEAIKVVTRLCRELDGAPDSAWDVFPFLLSSDKRYQSGLENFISQPIVELLVDMLCDKSGSVWTPFDDSGQIALTALRRGYVVHTASILGNESLIRHLLTCIDTGAATHPKLITEVTRDERGRPMTRADFIIADLPFGYSLSEEQRGQWAQYESVRSLNYDRAEAWAVSNLTSRADRQLLMLSSQNWLFSTGQERRLRESLIEKSEIQLNAIVTLPAGAISATNVATAIASFGQGDRSDAILMTDVRSGSRVDAIESLVEKNRPAILGLDLSTKNSRLVSVQEVRAADYVLLPQRLFRTIDLAGVEGISLGEICEAIRPPTPYKGVEGRDVIELGVPNLRDGRWSPIEYSDDDTEKFVVTNPSTRHEIFLSKDDIVLSVKGTLGLARLVSDYYGPSEDEMADWVRAIVSTSCIALRLSRGAVRKGITPRYLLMYLRSSEGQEQICSLQVGAGMPHISIQTLMSAVRIPVPNPQQHDEVTADFEKLCSIESHIRSLRDEMEMIVGSRWLTRST